MKQIHIAIIALQQGNKYILQLRGGKDTERGALGLVGFFGGVIDGKENALETAQRELSEETNLNLPASDFKGMGIVNVLSDFNNEPVKVIAEVFAVQVPPTTKVELNLEHEEQDVINDEIVFATKTEIEKLMKIAQLTPATIAAFKELIWP